VDRVKYFAWRERYDFLFLYNFGFLPVDRALRCLQRNQFLSTT
jgi:hypothetical protein